jgi:hypothetical protein
MYNPSSATSGRIVAMALILWVKSSIYIYIYDIIWGPVPGGFNTALLVGGIPCEKVKYGHEFCGTWTRQWLLQQGSEAIIWGNYRSILSSERAPRIKKPVIVRQETKIWSWASDGSPTPNHFNIRESQCPRIRLATLFLEEINTGA